jgi:hypothetical protein
MPNYIHTLNEMFEMQKRRNDKIRNNHGKTAKTALVLSIVSSLLCLALIAAPAEAKSKFKIEVQICCANSDSGSVKVKAKLPDGSHTSKKVNLAKLADKQDWDNVSVFLKLKHRYESFKVCVTDLGCQWGEAGDPVVFRGLDQ